MRTFKIKYLPLLMWLLPLLFFSYQFILRLWPGLMLPQIMNQLSIDASHFGILAACYYYGYAGMQIPVAILLDRYGVRLIVFIFATLCGVATLIFTYTDNFYLATVSRFLVGAGSAVGFLGVSKVISEWFTKDQYARMVGYSFTFGLMGAIYGGKPISVLINSNSWQNVALTLGVISIAIGVAAYIVIRSPKSNKIKVSQKQFELANFKAILTFPLLWFLALSNLLMVGALEGFADVWGVQYLMAAYNLEKGDAAGLISFVFFGMLFGGPFLALISKKLGNYTVISICGLGMALAFCLLLVGKIYSHFILSCLFFAVGIMCCYQVIVFAVGAELVPAKQLGITIAFLNSINMLGGSFFHTVIGVMLDLFWSGGLNSDGIRLYTVDAYQYAFIVIPISACLGAIMVLAISLRVKNLGKSQSIKAV